MAAGRARGRYAVGVAHRYFRSAADVPALLQRGKLDRLPGVSAIGLDRDHHRHGELSLIRGMTIVNWAGINGFLLFTGFTLSVAIIPIIGVIVISYNALLKKNLEIFLPFSAET